MTVSFVGLGKLGSSFLTICAEKGFNTIGVDKSIKIVKSINKGIALVEELKLKELLKKNLAKIKATKSIDEAVFHSEITFIIVPTPTDENGGFSNQFLLEAIHEIAKGLRKKDAYHLVVINSTVIPGSIDKEIIPILESISGKKCGVGFGVCYNPLFVALGSVIQDIVNPDFVLIGESDTKSGEILEKFYKQILENEAPVKRVNIVNAELIKIAVNAFITTKISFANTLSQICENLPNSNVDVVTNTIGLDSRIGLKYLKAGLGFGGPCFPRDNTAFSYVAKNALSSSPLAEATDSVNREQVNRIIQRLLSSGHNLSKIAVLGLAYKANTPVIEDSQGLEIALTLSKLGYKVYAHDPLVRSEQINGEIKLILTDSVDSCVEKADAIIVTLPYEQYILTPEQIETANSPVILDLWRLLDSKSLRGKVTYLAVGLPEDKLFNLNNLRKQKVVVCGAGGFIGGHLVADLVKKGYTNIQAIDIKPIRSWNQYFKQVDNLQLDLSDANVCNKVLKGADLVYNLASDMGGMGFIEKNKALCMLNVLINTHLLQAATKHKVKRYFFASSACVYAQDKQISPDVTPLKEFDAYPAMPEDGYGWEKLFSERMCRHFREDFGLETRVARFHNVYGSHGAYKGGREKAPAAICRKVIESKLSGINKIEIWGDGNQTRSFTFISDCIKGIQDIMFSDITEPVNLGSSEMVTINQLVDIVEEIAGVKLNRKYNLLAPKGVNGRNSDNTLIKAFLGWEPETKLKKGLEPTFQWIHKQMTNKVQKKQIFSKNKLEQIEKQDSIEERVIDYSTEHDYHIRNT